MARISEAKQRGQRKYLLESTFPNQQAPLTRGLLLLSDSYDIRFAISRRKPSYQSIRCMPFSEYIATARASPRRAAPPRTACLSGILANDVVAHPVRRRHHPVSPAEVISPLCSVLVSSSHSEVEVDGDRSIAMTPKSVCELARPAICLDVDGCCGAAVLPVFGHVADLSSVVNT